MVRAKQGFTRSFNSVSETPCLMGLISPFCWGFFPKIDHYLGVKILFVYLVGC